MKEDILLTTGNKHIFHVELSLQKKLIIKIFDAHENLIYTIVFEYAEFIMVLHKDDLYHPQLQEDVKVQGVYKINPGLMRKLTGPIFDGPEYLSDLDEYCIVTLDDVMYVLTSDKPSVTDVTPSPKDFGDVYLEDLTNDTLWEK